MNVRALVEGVRGTSGSSSSEPFTKSIEVGGATLVWIKKPGREKIWGERDRESWGKDTSIFTGRSLLFASRE